MIVAKCKPINYSITHQPKNNGTSYKKNAKKGEKPKTHPEILITRRSLPIQHPRPRRHRRPRTNRNQIPQPPKLLPQKLHRPLRRLLLRPRPARHQQHIERGRVRKRMRRHHLLIHQTASRHRRDRIQRGGDDAEREIRDAEPDKDVKGFDGPEDVEDFEFGEEEEAEASGLGMCCIVRYFVPPERLGGGGEGWGYGRVGGEGGGKGGLR